MSEWIEKVKATKERHLSMTCKVFELKIDSSHLSTQKLNYLKRIFLEAKWLQNYILSSNSIFNFDTKINKVAVLNKDKESEERDILYLSSQMKQAVKQKLTNAIKALSAKKKNKSKKIKKTKKDKIGKIKFTSEYKALVLNQYNFTYRFIDNKYLKLQGCKYRFKIEGLKQIPNDTEITNATLCHRHNDFYLKVTCFLPKEEVKYQKESVGIDFGISTNLTLSTGEKYNIKLPEHGRLRRQKRKLSKKVKDSQNYIKFKSIVNKEYHKLTNRKKDEKNKIVSKIVKRFKVVVVQDESIAQWHSGLFGKQVQQSLMSGIMSDLERKSHTFIKVDKWFPSTQLCPNCGKKNLITLEQRKYQCQCGFEEDRDLKSAKCIETEGLKIRKGLTESTPVESGPLYHCHVDNDTSLLVESGSLL